MSGLVHLGVGGLAAASLKHFSTLGHKESHHLHSLFEQAAGVAAQVERYALYRGVGFQHLEGFFPSRAGALVEGRNIDISYISTLYAIIRHRIDANLIANKRKGLNAIGHIRALHGHSYRSFGRTLEHGTHLLGAVTCHISSIDFENMVARLNACIGRWRAYLRLGEYHHRVALLNI